MMWFSLKKMTLVAMRRVDWKKAKMEAKRPVKRPLQLPRQQMKARTREVEWDRVVCVQELLSGSVIYWDRDNKTLALPPACPLPKPGPSSQYMTQPQPWMLKPKTGDPDVICFFLFPSCLIQRQIFLLCFYHTSKISLKPILFSSSPVSSPGQDTINYGLSYCNSFLIVPPVWNTYQTPKWICQVGSWICDSGALKWDDLEIQLWELNAYRWYLKPQDWMKSHKQRV